MYQLLCQQHGWVAKLIGDKRWKHLSAKLLPRLGFIDRSQITTLIGFRFKRSNALSREVLINHSYTLLNSCSSQRNFARQDFRSLQSAITDRHFNFHIQFDRTLPRIPMGQRRRVLSPNMGAMLKLLHLFPFRTQKWNTSRPMIVLLRESRSLPYLGLNFVYVLRSWKDRQFACFFNLKDFL